MATKISRLSSRVTCWAVPSYLQNVLAKSCTSTTRSTASMHAAPSNASSSSSEGGSKLRFSVLVLLLPCAATFGLGTWQLFRRQWKTEVLDFRRRRLEEYPVQLKEALLSMREPPKSESDGSLKESLVENLEFRKVLCEGVYDEPKSVFVGPRMKSVFGVSQKGYYLITPLKAGDEENSLQVPVLVNRGWVPSSWREEFVPGAPLFSTKHTETDPDVAEGKKRGQGTWWKLWSRKQDLQDDIKGTILSKKLSTIKVCGVIRGSEQPNMFVPANVPASGQWFYIDVPAIAQAAGLSEDAVFLDAVYQGSDSKLSSKGAVYPATKDPADLLYTSVMPRDHLNYALTWYSLAAATTFMTMKRLQSSRRRF